MSDPQSTTIPALRLLHTLYQHSEFGNINFRFLSNRITKDKFLPLAALWENSAEVSKILQDNSNSNCYFGVALREGTNGKKDGISQIPSLWLDLDGSPLTPITDSPWTPSAVVETSPGKFHVYWKLKEPAIKSEIPAVENILKRLAAHFEGDRAATDASRILRLPGTSNYKLSPPFIVAVKSISEAEYNLSDFDGLPEIEDQKLPGPALTNRDADRIKRILSCKFLEHCNKDRTTLSEPQWYAMISILAREPGGRDLIHSLSQGYPKYSRIETDQKILHALSAGPATCQRIKELWNCRQQCGVNSPIRLALRLETAKQPTEFPRYTIRGLAGEFADLYSEYLESPWSFFAFSYLTCLGSILSDRVSLRSEISPQPRLYTVNLGESGDDRKSEAIKKTIVFFEDAMAHGEFRVCHGVGSAEGLAKKLGEVETGPKKLLLVYDELKSFVGKAMIEGATLLPAVNSFFEGNRFHSATKTHSVELNDVFLSLLGASTIETFSRMWTPVFLDIGFLNRLWLIRDHGERKFSIPKEIPFEEIKNLQCKLGDLLKKFPHAVKLPIDEDARAVFDRWYFSVNPSPFTKRLDTYGLRLMVLLAINEGSQEVTEEIASNVVQLLQWQLQVRREVDPVDAENSIARTEEIIRRALSSGPLSKRDLQRKTNYQRMGIFIWQSAMKNLQSAREVIYDQKGGLYRLI